MNIFFDFELSGYEPMDAHLVDIMFALREELRKKLEPYIDRINQQNGDAFIRIIPGEFGIGYLNIDSELQVELVKNVNEKFDFEASIRNVAQKDLN